MPHEQTEHITNRNFGLNKILQFHKPHQIEDSKHLDVWSLGALCQIGNISDQSHKSITQCNTDIIVIGCLISILIAKHFLMTLKHPAFRYIIYIYKCA